jgi:hypothetical protein
VWVLAAASSIQMLCTYARSFLVWFVLFCAAALKLSLNVRLHYSLLVYCQIIMNNSSERFVLLVSFAGSVIKELKKYLERVISQSSISLDMLSKIEQKLLSEFSLKYFDMLQQGSFLEFLLKNNDIKKVGVRWLFNRCKILELQRWLVNLFSLHITCKCGSASNSVETTSLCYENM